MKLFDHIKILTLRQSGNCVVNAVDQDEELPSANPTSLVCIDPFADDIEAFAPQLVSKGWPGVGVAHFDPISKQLLINHSKQMVGVVWITQGKKSVRYAQEPGLCLCRADHLNCVWRNLAVIVKLATFPLV